MGNSGDLLEGGELGEDEVSIFKGFYYLGAFLKWFSRSAVSSCGVVCPTSRWASFFPCAYGNFGETCVREVQIIAIRSRFGFGQGAVIDRRFFFKIFFHPPDTS